LSIATTKRLIPGASLLTPGLSRTRHGRAVALDDVLGIRKQEMLSLNSRKRSGSWQFVVVLTGIAM
jgi:hypothetical protein